jgi:uncharacterized membrane protein YeaQ/YmgE (transglycosylase-associated protein family)
VAQSCAEPGGRVYSEVPKPSPELPAAWLASKVMRTDAQQGIFLNIVVGIIGAALAKFLLSPLLGIPTINSGNFSIGALAISFVGAIVLLAIVNFFRRGSAR